VADDRKDNYLAQERPSRFDADAKRDAAEAYQPPREFHGGRGPELFRAPQVQQAFPLAALPGLWETVGVAAFPVVLLILSQRLLDRDANDTGPDDTWGRVLATIAPVAPSIVAGATSGKSATLKAMRALEQIAHAYRVAEGDIADE
jgi:hypothetical protein